MAKSNLAIRLTTAAVAAPLLLVLLFRGPAWGFSLLATAAAGIAALEIFRMTHPGDGASQGFGAVSAAAVTFGLSFAAPDPTVIFGVLVGVPLLGMLVPLARLGDIRTAALRVMTGAAVPIYVGAPLGVLALLRRDFGEDGPGLVLLTLMLAWFADTGGYFVGRFFGKTKLYEAVSPKKTREGLFGAVLGSLAGALLAHFTYLPSLGLTAAILLGLAGGPLGQCGDLVESLLKRSLGTKDSGGIIPGHGGILDRIDALLVLAPVVYLYTLER
ncbi:MAG TPA: phosphatidate cytidylyltransferase [Polyangiaceae bacterium]